MTSTVLLGSMLTGCRKEESKKPVKTNYDILELGEMPIGLWVTPPAQYINDENYKVMSEAGINFINGFREETPDNINAAMDYAQKYGMKFFLYQTEIEQKIKLYDAEMKKEEPNLDLTEGYLNSTMSGISDYKDHPAFAGVLFLDEPGKPLFNSVNEFINAFKTQYSDKQWLVNMFPSYATGGIQSNGNYMDYLDTWLDLVKPNYFSYDSYPLLQTGGETADYYYNLDLIRSKTKERNIPFWTFIQTLSISGTPGVPDKREPSEKDIRWQVYTNLAFGAKGLQYFCYWSPGNGSESFGDALIDTNGNKTVRYDYVKKLNTEIYEIAKILLNCDAEGIMMNVKNGDMNYNLYDQKLTSYGPITSIGGDSFVIGCFSDKDTEAKKVLVSSYKPTASANVVLNIIDGVESVKIWVNGEKRILPVNNNQIEFTIGAGDGILFEF